MSYSVYILPSGERDGNALSKEIYQRCRSCRRKILALAIEPRPQGCQKLVGEDGYRIRIGDYRILYRIDEHAKKVFIYRIKHRREVYR